MKKISFLVLHLGFGGVEKAICNQANILCNDFDVEIISTYKLYDSPPFFLKPPVKVTYLLDDMKPNRDELKDAIQSKNIISIFKQIFISLRVLYLRKSLMKKAIMHLNSDIVISSRILYNKMLRNNISNGATIVAQEHVYHGDNKRYIRKLVSSVSNFDYFMPVSKELTDFYEQKLAATKTSCVYIPHNLDFWPDNPSQCKNKNLVSVGRLSDEKGYPDLIEIFSEIQRKHKEWSLHIIGDGPQRTTIEERIAHYSLQDKVILHGFQSNEYVKKMLSNASIYMMASFEESFGIVLLEAQSFGLPCVAFDSARGATEIISDGLNGYLVTDRDIDAYVKRVSCLIENEQLRTDMGIKGRENADAYKEVNAAMRWKEFFDSILNKADVNNR